MQATVPNATIQSMHRARFCAGRTCTLLIGRSLKMLASKPSGSENCLNLWLLRPEFEHLAMLDHCAVMGLKTNVQLTGNRNTQVKNYLMKLRGTKMLCKFGCKLGDGQRSEQIVIHHENTPSLG